MTDHRLPDQVESAERVTYHASGQEGTGAADGDADPISLDSIDYTPPGWYLAGAGLPSSPLPGDRPSRPVRLRGYYGPHRHLRASVVVRSYYLLRPQRNALPRRGALLAARLAGRRRLHLRNEWASLLAGEEGRGLPRHRRIALVAGFLLAAFRMRARDFLGFLWSPVDWLLSTEARTNGASTMAVGALVVYIHATDGLHTLLTEGWAWCAGCGVAVRMLFAWLRRVRGVELATAAPSSGDGE